jgi:hypothetical protein
MKLFPSFNRTVLITDEEQAINLRGPFGSFQVLFSHGTETRKLVTLDLVEFRRKEQMHRLKKFFSGDFLFENKSSRGAGVQKPRPSQCCNFARYIQIERNLAKYGQL